MNIGETSLETVSLSSNNIYGNHPCGLENTSATLARATHNFWGVAGGPGQRPADKVCGYNYSSTITTPFATTEFPIYH